jgi:hypothetical protein
MGAGVYSLSQGDNPVYTIPQNTIGFVIIVESGTYVMTGQTAELLLRLNQNPPPAEPIVVPLALTVQSGGLSANYTTVGNEFANPGLYDAQLKVTASGILLYSLALPKLVYVQGVLG